MLSPLGSWVELVVPNNCFESTTVRAALEKVTKAVGGATVTEGRGTYVSTDGTTMYEAVLIFRWEFRYEEATMGELEIAISGATEAMLNLGEECVLRKTFIRAPGTTAGHYFSELIYGPTRH